MQGDAAAADAEAKIWSVGRAIHNDLVENAGKFSSRRKDAANAFDCAEVCVVERIGSADRSVTRAVRLPWAKRSTGNDVADGFGIRKVGVKMHGLPGANARHLQVLYVKLQRQLARFQSVDYQLCPVKDELIDYDFDLAALGA